MNTPSVPAVDLHAQIMNIPAQPLASQDWRRFEDAPEAVMLAYKIGHRDARHAAAELVSAATPAVPAEPADLDMVTLTSDWHITYLARGHIEPQAMKDAVIKDRDGDLKGFSDPRHEWWRRFPKWEDGERVPWYQEAKPNARGAFRCTVMVKDW